ELVAQGRLDRLGARYRLRRSDGFVEGTFSPPRNPPGGAGEGGGRRRGAGGLFWQGTKWGDAPAGDRVLLQPLGAARQAEIVGVLEGRREAWVGVVERHGRLPLGTPWRDSAGAVLSV